MSSSAESRIVTMQFNNSQFEQGATQSLSTLQRLKAALSFDNMRSGLSKAAGGIGSVFSKFRGGGAPNPFASAQQGLSSLQQQANGFNTGAITGGVQGISKSFVAMSTVAITAIANITNRVLNAGISWAKSFTFSPIMDGLREYETNLKSIQTVQANTDRPLKEVEASLEQLNKYSDQTIYNFSEMARNVGTFTAAGVDLDTSVSSIKGIANIAALSGSSSQQAATAMYQLSQAISSGRVGLQDWNSVVNAGMGGKKLQNALAQTAIAMGEIDKTAVKMVGPMKKLEIQGGSFRESIMAKPGEQSWLTSDILVNTLATMDGRFSKAALAAERNADGTRKYTKAQIEAEIATARTNLETKNGVKYTDAQFEALQKMSTQAFKSATEVKTLGQVFDIAKETLASGWSASFKNIFGNLKEAKSLFTGMSQGLNDIINDNALARNTMLASWKKMGGRDTLIDGLRSAWMAFSGVLGTVHDAFRDIFPATTARGLLELTRGFESFMHSLIPSKDALDTIGRIARGVFAAISIGISIIKGFAGVVGDLIGTVAGGSGGFFEFVAGIGDFLVALDLAIKKGGLLEGFFNGLSSVLQVPLRVLGNVAEAIGNMFGGFDTGGVGNAVGGIAARFDPIASAVERVRGAFAGFGQFVRNAVSGAIEATSGFAESIAEGFTAESFGTVLDTINTALLGGIVYMFRNFFNGAGSVDIGGGLFSQIKDTLGGVTDALGTMQTNLKADILMKLAGAIGVMALSLLVLSTIDPKRMATGLAGLAGAMYILQAGLLKVVAALGPLSAAKLIGASLAIMGVATAMLMLAGAVKIFASMNLGTMLRGLVGLGLAMLILVKGIGPLAANASGMVRAGAGLILIALALRIMAESVQAFGSMDLSTMAKGLGGIAASLLILAGALRVMPKDIFLQAAALLILGAALKVIGSAIAQLGSMDVGVLVQGIAGIAGALLVIAAAMRLMPGPTLLIQAAALVVLSGALAAIGQVVASMGGLSIEVIATGLATLAGSLVILAAGLYLMSGTLGGAAALVIAAGALAILTPILITLGSLSLGTIVTALIALGGTFAVLGVAGLLLAPMLPILAGLAAVLLVFGAGLALVGAGALAFATAFGIVVAAGSAGAVVLGAILNKIIQSIPRALQAFGQGIVKFAQAIAKGAPAFFKAFGAIINSLLRAATQAIPKLGKLFTTLIQTALNVITRLTPSIVNAGLRMIVQFLAAVSRNVPKITQHASDIIVKFLNTLSKNLPRIIQAGVRLVISFVNGVAQAIRNNSDEMGRAGGNLALALVEGMANGIANGVSTIASAARNLASNAFSSAMDFLRAKSPSRLFMDVGSYIPAGMAIGIDSGARTVSKASAGLGKSAYSAMKATMTGMAAGIPEMEVRPTITPVLDLSEARKGAGGLASMLDQNKMRADISYQNAASVSAELAAAAQAALENQGNSGNREVKVEVTQHNHSPKALPAREIYKNTKSLMAMTKEALESSEHN